ncbi:MAG: hypothetical protein ACK5L5_04630 [Bacteroidales bacterium]
MKRLVLLFLVAVTVHVASAQVFDYGQIRVGGGLSYLTEIADMGLNANVIYSTTPRSELAAAYTYAFEKKSTRYNLFDFDWHWVLFDNHSKLNAYVLTGICFASSEVKTPLETVSDSNLAINAGLGLNYRLSDRFI